MEHNEEVELLLEQVRARRDRTPGWEGIDEDALIERLGFWVTKLQAELEATGDHGGGRSPAIESVLAALVEALSGIPFPGVPGPEGAAAWDALDEAKKVVSEMPQRH